MDLEAICVGEGVGAFRTQKFLTLKIIHEPLQLRIKFFKDDLILAFKILTFILNDNRAYDSNMQVTYNNELTYLNNIPYCPDSELDEVVSASLHEAAFYAKPKNELCVAYSDSPEGRVLAADNKTLLYYPIIPGIPDDYFGLRELTRLVNVRLGTEPDTDDEI